MAEEEEKKMTIQRIGVRAGETLTGAWRGIRQRATLGGDSSRIRSGDSAEELQRLVAMRGVTGLRGEALFNEVFGETALLDVEANRSIFQNIWSPSGEPTRATLKCTIAQFERLLELAPKDWARDIFPESQVQIVSAERSAREDDVPGDKIKEAKMTYVSYRQWDAIATLLDMKVYFGGARCFIRPVDFRFVFHYYPVLRNLGVGAGFAE